MSWTQTLVLALLQGATEFIPVSSSGHLVLARRMLGWSDEGGLPFDVLLHAASLAAILIYFHRDWARVFLSYAGKEIPDAAFYRRLPWLLAMATAPVAIAAPFLKEVLEHGVRGEAATGLSMILTALWFWLCERRSRVCGGKGAALTWRDAWWIGCAQVIALLPGASRAGWTAGAGILCGQDRERAVRFAFFMAVPAIAGAVLFEARDLLTGMHSASGGYSLAHLAIGFVVCLAASLATIHFCLRFFRTRSLAPFAVYLACVGAVALALGLAG